MDLNFCTSLHLHRSTASVVWSLHVWHSSALHHKVPRAKMQEDNKEGSNKNNMNVSLRWHLTWASSLTSLHPVCWVVGLSVYFSSLQSFLTFLLNRRRKTQNCFSNNFHSVISVSDPWIYSKCVFRNRIPTHFPQRNIPPFQHGHEHDKRRRRKRDDFATSLSIRRLSCGNMATLPKAKLCSITGSCLGYLQGILFGNGGGRSPKVWGHKYVFYYTNILWRKCEEINWI